MIPRVNKLVKISKVRLFRGPKNKDEIEISLQSIILGKSLDSKIFLRSKISFPESKINPSCSLFNS